MKEPEDGYRVLMKDTTDFAVIKRMFNARVELDALITEREGMIWENHHEMLCNGHVVYAEEAFNNLADRFRALKEG